MRTPMREWTKNRPSKAPIDQPDGPQAEEGIRVGAQFQLLYDEHVEYVAGKRPNTSFRN